jgi:hypothetical protein
MRSKPRAESIPLKLLLPFPAQSEVFDLLSEIELAELADDIKQRGLRHPDAQPRYFGATR